MIEDALVNLKAKAYLAQRRTACKLAIEQVKKLVIATQLACVIVAVVLGHYLVEFISRHEVNNL